VAQEKCYVLEGVQNVYTIRTPNLKDDIRLAYIVLFSQSYQYNSTLLFKNSNNLHVYMWHSKNVTLRKSFILIHTVSVHFKPTYTVYCTFILTYSYNI